MSSARREHGDVTRLKLKLDYDKMKFQQIFDQEMKKLADEQAGR